MTLQEEIADVLDKCPDQKIRTAYEARLGEGELVRDENEHSHFCAYFVPYNPTDKTILVGNHKIWVMVDAGRTHRC